MTTQTNTNLTPLMLAPKRSVDPRVVLLAFISLTVWITYASGWVGAVLGVAVAMILAVLPGFGSVAVVRLLRMLRWSLPFALLVFVLYALLTPAGGGEAIRLGPLSVSVAALETGLRLSLRLVAFVILAQSLMIYTTPAKLAAGITRILLPTRRLGLKPATLHHFMFLTFRLLPAMANESRTIRLGQQSRGWRPSRSIFGRVRSAPAIIVPVFAAAMRRADALATVMISRGFDPDAIPAHVLMLHFTKSDYLILLLILLGWAGWVYIHFFAGRVM